MLLILTPNNRNDEIRKLGRTAEILGWDVYYSKGSWWVPENLMGAPGAVYGEQFFCEVVASQMNWSLLYNSLDWLAKLPKEYTCRNILFTKLSAARKITEEKFIKPADDKCFPARVYANGSELPPTVIDEAPVLVSDVMRFTSEYRCFIKNRNVVSTCCYYYKGVNMQEAKINDPTFYWTNHEAVVDFVNKMLKDDRIECVKGSVIDVGRFQKDKYAVIESNPVYASGLYGCDTVAALDAIKSACVRVGEPG